MNVTLIAPPWFEVPPRGHGGIETVVATRAGYVVVEKRGEAGMVAEDTDPRE